MMKYILILGNLLSLFSLAFAQTIREIPRQKFFTTAIGATWQTRKDNVFTPLSYTGLGAELHLGSERINDTWYKKLDVWGSFNQMYSRVDKGYNGSAYGVRYGISYLMAKRIQRNNDKFNIYVGGMAFNESSMGIYLGNVNNIFSYNVPTGVAAAAYLNKELRFFKRNWLLSTQFTLPVVAYNARPSYIGFVSVDNLLKDFGIVTVNKLLNIDWRWQLDLHLSNSNRLRLIYRWSFLNDTHIGHLQMGSQGLSVESLFNLPYKIKNKT